MKGGTTMAEYVRARDVAKGDHVYDTEQGDKFEVVSVDNWLRNGNVEILGRYFPDSKADELGRYLDGAELMVMSLQLNDDASLLDAARARWDDAQRCYGERRLDAWPYVKRCENVSTTLVGIAGRPNVLLCGTCASEAVQEGATIIAAKDE